MLEFKPNSNHLAQSQVAIGVFDSGVGGISVLQHIHALLPHENLIYVADSKNAPYGNKTPAEITQRCFALADFLIAKNVKALVVACNTATAAAIDALREHYAIPIIGMEPAVKPAAEASKNGIVGVLATTGTLKSAQFAALLESYGRNVKVVTQACVGLVECVERGELNTPNTKALIRQYCVPLLTEGADTIVLGCTHYPFVREAISEIVGKSISLIDTGAAVAKQLKRQLAESQLLMTETQLADVTFWTNSEASHARQVIEALWGKSTNVNQF
ncbi:MAG: glutamate racemase [Methylophilaceae bacterium]